MSGTLHVYFLPGKKKEVAVMVPKIEEHNSKIDAMFMLEP